MPPRAGRESAAMSAIRSPVAALAWNGAFTEGSVTVRREIERAGRPTNAETHGQTHARADARQPPRYADCIPVRSLDRIVIVRVQAIVRLEADDNYVRIWADRMYLHKETLAGLCARLDPAHFLRVHRSHAVRIDSVRELVPRLHGEYLLKLGNGVSLISGRSYRAVIRAAFGLE
jgi:two-component system LytT family response regulator